MIRAYESTAAMFGWEVPAELIAISETLESIE
jgi:hypothetical protein